MNSEIANIGQNYLPPLLSIVFLAVGVIAGLDCIWRVEKRLDTFIKLFVLGVVGLLIKNILILLGVSNGSLIFSLLQYVEALSSALFLLALGEMYKIIRSIDKE